MKSLLVMGILGACGGVLGVGAGPVGFEGA